MIALNLTVMIRPFVTPRLGKDAAERNARSSADAGFDGFPFPRSLRHGEAAKRRNSRSPWWAGHQIGCFR